MKILTEGTAEPDGSERATGTLAATVPKGNGRFYFENPSKTIKQTSCRPQYDGLN